MLPPSSLVFLQGWGLTDLPLRAAFSPAHPLACRDAPSTRARAFRFLMPPFKGVPRLPSTARFNNPSKLARFSSLGRAPMLVYVRPSNEALLRARVPGAQDQRGCPSNPFHRARSASKEGTWPLPSSSFLGRALREHKGRSGYPASFFSSNNTLKSMRPSQAGWGW